ncbi:MAG TPA: hypothetical protein VI522_04095 [Gammaproteobacteria bacterium]|nr:hypothetical protein [Gammaproteobacteria bacterium]
MKKPTKNAQKILKALPGLVGAIDKAVFDIAGRPHVFAVVIFAEGQAMHATNGDNAQVMEALRQMLKE